MSDERYEGHFSKNKFHGKGTFHYSFDAIFSGTYKHGLREGPGSLTIKKDYSLTGAYQNDKITGEITYKSNGNIYVSYPNQPPFKKR